MAKRDDRIITSVYLTKEMCSQIDKMADRGHISRNEQIRRYIEKGLAVEGYSQDIDLIAGIIRQEVQAATISRTSGRWWNSRPTALQRCT